MEDLGTDRVKLSIPISRQTCILFYIYKVFGIDISYLHFLYKKFGNDLLYFFYMLAGKKISIPKVDRFILLFNNANLLFDKITKNPDIEIPRIKDKEIYKELLDSINKDTMEIEF